jgi:hypothetical protein
MAKTKLYSITEAFKEVSRLDHAKIRLSLENIRVNHEDSENFILGKSVATTNYVYFKNVIFKEFANDFVSISNNQDLFFTDCVFDKPITFRAGTFHFSNCIFKSDVNFLDIDQAEFDTCTFIDSIYVDRATYMYFTKCKINYVYMQNVCSDINFDYSPINEFFIEDCNLYTLEFEYSSVNNLKCSRCVIKNLDIWGNSKQTVEKLSLYNVLINNSLNIDGPKVNYLYAKNTMTIGNFLYNPTDVPKIEIKKSVGLVPPKNEIYLYKKCIIPKPNSEKFTPVIVKLQVPETAERVYCEDLKIRVSEAKVIQFYNMDGEVYKPRKDKYVCSSWDRKFKYNIGETIKPTEKFDPTSGTCGSGIHGFTNFEDAKAYVL